MNPNHKIRTKSKCLFSIISWYISNLNFINYTPKLLFIFICEYRRVSSHSFTFSNWTPSWDMLLLIYNLACSESYDIPDTMFENCDPINLVCLKIIANVIAHDDNYYANRLIELDILDFVSTYMTSLPTVIGELDNLVLYEVLLILNNLFLADDKKPFEYMFNNYQILNQINSIISSHDQNYTEDVINECMTI